MPGRGRGEIWYNILINRHDFGLRQKQGKRQRANGVKTATAARLVLSGNDCDCTRRRADAGLRMDFCGFPVCIKRKDGKDNAGMDGQPQGQEPHAPCVVHRRRDARSRQSRRAAQGAPKFGVQFAQVSQFSQGSQGHLISAAHTAAVPGKSRCLWHGSILLKQQGRGKDLTEKTLL